MEGSNNGTDIPYSKTGDREQDEVILCLSFLP